MKKFLSLLLAVMMVLSTVSFALPSVVGVADSVYEPEVVDTYVAAPEETAVLSADTWYDLEKGTLLYNMDFETDNSGNTVTSDSIAKVTRADGGFYADQAAPASDLGKLNPDVAVSTAYTIGFRYVSNSNKSLAAEGDNHYLSLVGNGSNNISLYLGYPMQKAGKYVLEFKYKFAPTSGVTLSYIECNTPSNGNVTDVATGEWKTFSKEYNVTGAVDSLRLRFIPTSGNITSTDALLIDEVKVYFYDPDVDYDSICNKPMEITDTWYDLTKGTKLFQMDFDANNEKMLVTSDALANVTNAGGTFTNTTAAPVSGMGRLNPDVSVSDYTLGFRYATNGSAKLVTDGNNKYFAINGNGTDNISFYLGKPFQKAGKYVLELKYKYDSVSGSALSTIDCNTPSNGTVTDVATGEWRTFSREYNVTGASDVRLRFCVSGGSVTSNDTLCFDDIVVWYYDESVDYDSMLNPDIETNDTWEDAEKGQKLFTIDFTAKNDKKALDSSSYDTLLNRLDNNPLAGELISDLGRINPAVDGSNYRISFNYINNANTELINDNGNVYLSVAPDGTKGDVSLYLGGFYGEEGTYTIETSYKFVKNGEYTVDRIRYETLGGLEYTDASYLSTGNWVDLSETHEHTGCSHGNVNRTRFTTNGYNNTPFSANDRIYIDNITVYFKAPETEEPEPEEPVASEWDNTEKGYRVFLADFETKNDGTAVISTDVARITSDRVDANPANAGIAATSAARVNPEYSSIARLNVKGGAGANIQGTADNQHLSLTSVGDSLILSQLYVGDGTYVIEFDANSSSIPEVRGSYSAGTVPTKQSVDARWTRYTFVSENVTEASSKSCSSYHTDNIRFYFGTAPSKYDNIVVYYQPTGWTPPSDDEGDEGEDEPTVNEWIDNNYGEKLFVIDLDGDTKYQTAALANLCNRIDGANDNVESNGLYLSAIGRTNPEYASYEGTFKYAFKDDNKVTPVVEGTDDKYFKHVTGGQASVMIANPFVGAGTYTVVFNHNANVDFKLHSGYGSTDGTVTTTVVDDTWATTVATVEISEQSSNDFFRIYANTAPGSYMIDDVALFYKPEGWTPPSEGGDDEPDEPDEPVGGEWEDATYGTKLFTVDFATKNDGTAVTATDVSTFANGRLDGSASAGVSAAGVGRVNPAYASKSFRIGLKDTNVVSLADAALSATTGSSSGNMSFYFRDTYVGPGTYTYVFDYNTASGKTFSIHSGYSVSGTLTTQEIDSTHTRVTYVVSGIDESNYISADTYASNYLRFYSSGASAEGKFVFDNIAVYYKNTVAEVTVKSNGNANVADTKVNVDKENGDTVANIVSKVDVSKSTKQLLGASLTAGGALLEAGYVVKPLEVSELYLIWGGDIVVDETPWYDEGYGTLLFNINWDGTLSTASQARWADVRAAGAVTNPDWNNFETCYFMWGTEDIGGSNWIPATSPLIVAEANGNRYYTEPHDSTYNHWSIYSILGGDWANFAAEDGVFTITYKIKTIGDITVNNLFVDPQTVRNHAVVNTGIRLSSSERPNSSEWTTVTYQVDLSEYTQNEGESLGHVMLYAQTNESSAVSGAYICYDDVKVYYKPSKVNVTLKPGTNPEVNETTVEASTKGVLVSELLSLVDMADTTMLANGIATEDGTKKYALTDTVVLDKDETFYITWEANDWMDSELGMLIQRADFEGEFLTTSINRWPAATDLGATINPDYKFEGVKGLQFTVSETGIALDSNSLWIPANYAKTENGNTYFEVPSANVAYGSTQQLTCISMYAMGAGASQYQYQGAGTYTITGKIKYGADIQNAIIELRPNLFNGSGLTGGYNYQFTETVAGEWNEFSVTWSTSEDSEYGLGSVYFYLFYDAISSKSTVAYDDIMLYYKPFTAEVTIRANNNPVAKDVVLSDVSTSGISTEELISNIRTPLGGMELVGLAYDKFGNNMLEGDIVIGGDTRFFMIWKESELDPNAPVSENVNAIRTDDPIGMRFRSYVTSTVYADATQVGWVATRLDMLEAKDINSYDFTIESDVTKIYAYNKDTDGTNKVFGTDDVNTYITAVLYNIPEKHYETTLVARPFTVVDGVTYYGFPVERSICEVAEALRDGGYAGCSNDQKAYIMNILTVCNKPTEPQA